MKIKPKSVALPCPVIEQPVDEQSVVASKKWEVTVFLEAPADFKAAKIEETIESKLSTAYEYAQLEVSGVRARELAPVARL